MNEARKGQKLLFFLTGCVSIFYTIYQNFYCSNGLMIKIFRLYLVYFISFGQYASRGRYVPPFSSYLHFVFLDHRRPNEIKRWIFDVFSPRTTCIYRVMSWGVTFVLSHPVSIAAIVRPPLRKSAAPPLAVAMWTNDSSIQYAFIKNIMSKEGNVKNWRGEIKKSQYKRFIYTENRVGPLFLTSK